jgi:hypothetical protein
MIDLDLMDRQNSGAAPGRAAKLAISVAALLGNTQSELRPSEPKWPCRWLASAVTAASRTPASDRLRLADGSGPGNQGGRTDEGSALDATDRRAASPEDTVALGARARGDDPKAKLRCTQSLVKLLLRGPTSHNVMPQSVGESARRTRLASWRRRECQASILAGVGLRDPRHPPSLCRNPRSHRTVLEPSPPRIARSGRSQDPSGRADSTAKGWPRL